MLLCRELRLIEGANIPQCSKLESVSVVDLPRCREVTMANMSWCWKMCLVLEFKDHGNFEVESVSVDIL